MSATTQTGVGPYHDWLEDVAIEDQAWRATQTRMPVEYVGDFGGVKSNKPIASVPVRGGMKTTQLALTFGSATDAQMQNLATTAGEKSFVAELAVVLGVPANLVFLTYPTDNVASRTVDAQVIGPAPPNHLAVSTTIGGLTVSAVTSTVVERTNDCYSYGEEPRMACPDDPAVTRFNPSRDEMSGVLSCPEDAGMFSITPACLTSGDAIVGFVMTGIIFGGATAIVLVTSGPG